MKTATQTPPGAVTGRALRPTAKALPEHGRAHNRSLVLGHLFRTGPSSRAEIARHTGLTRVTVSDLVTELAEEGLVAELGTRPTGKVGKPAVLVGMRTDELAIAALDLTDDVQAVGAVLSPHGEVLHRCSTPWRGAAGAEAAALVAALAGEVLAATDRRVIGVGVASPGVIAPDGVVVQAPNRGWSDVTLGADLAHALGLPVHVANDADTRALAEFTYGGAVSSGCLVLTVGAGVGAGIVVDGALVRGTHFAAGEIGHVTAVDETSGEPPQPCACGRRGCLETVLGVPALRRRTAGLDPDASDAVLASAGRLLGLVLAPVVSALDLAEVLLSGPPELLDGPLRDAALDTLRARTMPVISAGLVVRTGALGEDAALAGAAALVLSGQLGVS